MNAASPARLWTWWTAACVLAAAALGSAGCEAIAFLGAMGGEKVKAQYKLPNRPTLVMVEDPERHLGNPTLNSVAAANAAFHLKQNQALTAPLIDQAELTALEARLGQEYARTPIDQVGRLLGAEQVVHVQVDSVSMQTAPGVYRPTAIVQVKVIDVADGERLFPEAPRFTNPNAPPPGHRVKAQLSVRSAGTDGRGTTAVLAQSLAEEIGHTVARLFYDHKKPEPGSTL